MKLIKECIMKAHFHQAKCQNQTRPSITNITSSGVGMNNSTLPWNTSFHANIGQDSLRNEADGLVLRKALLKILKCNDEILSSLKTGLEQQFREDMTNLQSQVNRLEEDNSRMKRELYTVVRSMSMLQYVVLVLLLLAVVLLALFIPINNAHAFIGQPLDEAIIRKNSQTIDQRMDIQVKHPIIDVTMVLPESQPDHSFYQLGSSSMKKINGTLSKWFELMKETTCMLDSDLLI